VGKTTNKGVYPTSPYLESVQKFGCFRRGRNLALGLTGFGEQLAEKVLDMGMILDIPRCTPPAREKTYEIVGTRRPIVTSHVGAYEINPSPYNLKD
jgi:microsomal dipeptidase-like Zn-dependent dipeptidase